MAANGSWQIWHSDGSVVGGVLVGAAPVGMAPVDAAVFLIVSAGGWLSYVVK